MRRRSETDGTEAGVVDEIAADFSTEELMEFMGGDPGPGEADPAFKERLRGELWALVRRRYRQPVDEEA